MVSPISSAYLEALAEEPASNIPTRTALLHTSLIVSDADIRMLLEMLLLFYDSDSVAAVEAEEDLLSLAVVLPLSLVFAL